MGGGGGIGGSIGGIIGGIIGGDKASGDRSKGQGYAEQAFNELLAIGLPPDLSKEIIMQKFQEAGIMTPELEQEISVQHSKLAELQEDPETRNAQMEALNTFKSLSKTGLGAQDKAALNQVRDSVQRDLEGKRQQILQQMQQRGMGGSGAELITQLQASQGDANKASMESDRLAAMAQERALSALDKSAGLASNVRGQDYTVAANKAKAQDELNRFNVDNQRSVQSRNVAARNTAQAQNLSNKQRISDANVNMSNQEKLRQAQAQRDYWNDQLKRAQGRSSAYEGLGNEYNRRGDAIAGREQAIWTGIGNIAEKGAGMAFGMPPMPSGRTPSAGGSYNDYSAYAAHGGIADHDVKLPGDTIKDDKIPLMVNKDEAVIPASIMQSDDAPENAKLFLKLMMKLKDGKKQG